MIDAQDTNGEAPPPAEMEPQPNNEESWSVETDLWDGHFSGLIPRRFECLTEFLNAPDNQEVFRDKETQTSLIVELCERVRSDQLDPSSYEQVESDLWPPSQDERFDMALYDDDPAHAMPPTREELIDKAAFDYHIEDLIGTTQSIMKPKRVHQGVGANFPTYTGMVHDPKPAPRTRHTGDEPQSQCATVLVALIRWTATEEFPGVACDILITITRRLPADPDRPPDDWKAWYGRRPGLVTHLDVLFPCETMVDFLSTFKIHDEGIFAEP